MTTPLNFDPSKPQQCYVCLEEVSPKEEDSKGMSDCATCENGHYLHRHCWEQLKGNNKCGICRQPISYQCFNYHANEYTVKLRRGGKKSKRHNKRHRKSRKLRKTRKYR